jgi:hypothetical protein
LDNKRCEKYLGVIAKRRAIFMVRRLFFVYSRKKGESSSIRFFSFGLSGWAFSSG